MLLEPHPTPAPLPDSLSAHIFGVNPAAASHLLPQEPHSQRWRRGGGGVGFCLPVGIFLGISPPLNRLLFTPLRARFTSSSASLTSSFAASSWPDLFALYQVRCKALKIAKR